MNARMLLEIPIDLGCDQPPATGFQALTPTGALLVGAAALAFAAHTKLATRERNRLEALDGDLAALHALVTPSPERELTREDLTNAASYTGVLQAAAKRHRKLRESLHLVLQELEGACKSLDEAVSPKSTRGRRARNLSQQTLGAAVKALRDAIAEARDRVRMRRSR
ncbi:hypothetical protein [Streptomyces sp. NPDC093223]|uniref:hypothetical protein n=1 Tax=Streptomyces sp. NPDC093223 TaxID=3366033 RepID=UPI00382E414C